MADGIFYALNRADLQDLLVVRNNYELLVFLQHELATRPNDGWRQPTAQSWDVLHRCLGNGTLRRTGETVREKCVLGGRQLYRGEEYIISFLAPEDVRAVDQALEPLTRAWFRRRYFWLKKKFLWFDFSDYQGPINESTFTSAWDYFEQVRAFYHKAAAGKRAMIFMVQQFVVKNVV